MLGNKYLNKRHYCHKCMRSFHYLGIARHRDKKRASI